MSAKSQAPRRAFELEIGYGFTLAQEPMPVVDV